MDVRSGEDHAADVASLRDALLRHRGATIGELRDEVAPHVSLKAKNVTSVTIANVLDRERPGLRRDLDTTMLRRVVRADETTYRPKEAVSFASFEFMDVIGTPWEESALRERVARIVFIVLLFRKGAAVHEARLHNVFQWEADHRTLATMEQEYEWFRNAFAYEDPVAWPRPGMTEILHVRPHGRDATDVLPLPGGRFHVRSSFWLNQPFVQLLIRLNDA
jgi:DNA mismatch repair protein MutH